jgi:hypothetical protein
LVTAAIRCTRPSFPPARTTTPLPSRSRKVSVISNSRFGSASATGAATTLIPEAVLKA